MRQFSEIQPYATGLLDAGEGHRLYWETCGNPDGKPAVVLHGGPGSGCSSGMRRMFDPSAYRIVLFDQRNCGRSSPHASEADVDLSTNTTAALVGDCERLREHLGIDRWLVWGGSWGSTLGLAYAQAHPDRVTGMILVSVVTTTRREVEWVTRDMGRVFPDEWARFRDGVPDEDRDGDLSVAYSRLLESSDPAIREQAARDWCAWEDTHVATYPGHRPDPRYDEPRFRLCFARLVTHYWSNAAFLEDGQLLRDANRLAEIPAVLINGRLDISGPSDIAFQLAQTWPGAELVIVEGAGHGGLHQGMNEANLAATQRFGRTG